MVHEKLTIFLTIHFSKGILLFNYKIKINFFRTFLTQMLESKNQIFVIQTAKEGIIKEIGKRSWVYGIMPDLNHSSNLQFFLVRLNIKVWDFFHENRRYDEEKWPKGNGPRESSSNYTRRPRRSNWAHNADFKICIILWQWILLLSFFLCPSLIYPSRFPSLPLLTIEYWLGVLSTSIYIYFNK